jgi:hypothetical protein
MGMKEIGHEGVEWISLAHVRNLLVGFCEGGN